MLAYAIKITEENMWAIASEHPRFNLEEFNAWLADHMDGYFLRDETSPFDCRYFDSTIFRQFYIFKHPDSGELFQQVQKV